jgi:hypothetical protein
VSKLTPVARRRLAINLRKFAVNKARPNFVSKQQQHFLLGAQTRQLKTK